MEPLVIQNETLRNCLKIKRACHAVFDRMNGWFGISSLESLSHGIPVLAGLDDWNIRHLQEFSGKKDVPWIVVRDEEALYSGLAALIKDPSLRIEKGAKGREFMESAWNEERVTKMLVDVDGSL